MDIYVSVLCGFYLSPYLSSCVSLFFQTCLPYLNPYPNNLPMDVYLYVLSLVLTYQDVFCYPLNHPYLSLPSSYLNLLPMNSFTHFSRLIYLHTFRPSKFSLFFPDLLLTQIIYPFTYILTHQTHHINFL